MSTITQEDVARLLQVQAEAFEKTLENRLRDQAKAFDEKIQDEQIQFSQHRNRFQLDLDEVRRQLQTLLVRSLATEKATQSTKATTQHFKAIVDGVTEKMDDHETALVCLSAKVQNFSLEMARIHDYLTAQASGNSDSAVYALLTQHEQMRILMDEIENALSRTNARRASEGSLACNCAHKTINEKIEKIGKRISSVEKRITKTVMKLSRRGDVAPKTAVDEHDEEANDHDMETQDSTNNQSCI